MINKLKDRNLKELLSTILYMGVGGAVFIVFGFYIPRIHLQYFDKTEYVRFVDPLSFDKKEYKPCETMKALVRLESKVSSQTQTSYRLMLIDSSTYEEVSAKTTEGFIYPTDGIEVHTTNFTLPCDLKVGNYFFKGLITYHVSGIEKNYQFTTDQFAIETD